MCIWIVLFRRNHELIEIERAAKSQPLVSESSSLKGSFIIEMIFEYHKVVKELKWKNVAYSITVFIVILFLNPYLNRMGFWLDCLFIVVLISCIDFTLSKIKFLQKSVTKKVGWSIVITAFILVGVLH